MNAIGKMRFPFAIVLLTIAGMLAIFWPMLRNPADHHYFGYGDSWTYYGPTSFYVDSAIHSGEFPLWNPLLLTGQPIAGNPQYVLFYPPNLIRSVLTVNPTPERTHAGLAVLQFLHAIIAGLGTYALARSFSISRPGACASAIAFVFSAALTQRMFGHMYIVQVTTWWPWALYGLRQVLIVDTARSRVRWSILLGASFALSILAGTPQMTHLVGFGLLLYWLVFSGFRLFDVRGMNSSAPKMIARLKLDVVGGALAVVVALGLAAALVIPAVQFSQSTPRGVESSEKYESVGTDADLNFLEKLTLYPGGTNYEGLKTLSAAGIIFAAMAFFGSRRRESCTLAVFALLLVDGSSDHSLFVHDLIVLSAPFPISAAGRGMLIAVLPLALLVGLGVDTLRERPKNGRARSAAAVIATLLGVGMVVVYLLRPSDYFVDLGVAGALFPIAAVIVALACLSFAQLRWVSLLAILVVLAEAVAWRGTYIKDMNARALDMFYPAVSTSPDRHAEFWRGNSRGTSRIPNTNLFGLRPAINGFDALHLHGIAELLYPRSDASAFRRAVDAFSMAKASNRTHLLLKRAFWLSPSWVEGEIPPADIDFPPTTVAFVADAAPRTVPRKESSEVPGEVFSNNVRLMRVSNREIVITPQDHPTPERPLLWQSRMPVPPGHKALSLHFRSDTEVEFGLLAGEDELTAEPEVVSGGILASTGGELGRVDLPMPDLEEFVIGLVFDFPDQPGTMTLERVELVIDEADENDKIAVVYRTPNSVEVNLNELPGPRILSHIDFLYPGWHAYLNGAEVPILRTFSYFKGVEVPEGTHTVRFEFRPRIVHISIAISVATAVACLALLAWTFRKPSQSS